MRCFLGRLELGVHQIPFLEFSPTTPYAGGAQAMPDTFSTSVDAENATCKAITNPNFQFVTVTHWISSRTDDSGPSMHARKDKLILVAGATGYVGGRLVPRLLQTGYRVRCLVRTPTNLQHQGVIAESVPKCTLRAGMIPRLDFAVER